MMKSEPNYMTTQKLLNDLQRSLHDLYSNELNVPNGTTLKLRRQMRDKLAAIKEELVESALVPQVPNGTTVAFLDSMGVYW